MFVSNSAGRAMAVGPIGVYAVQVIFVGSAEKSRNRKWMIDSPAAFPYPPFRYEAARLWWPFSVIYLALRHERSEGRRVGKLCLSQCRSRWSPFHFTKKRRKQYRRK